jgi:hypothetical protein
VITLKRPRPDFSGWQEHEKGLPFKNGRFNVEIDVLDGRGNSTGKTEVAASFAAPELADTCRDRINTQDQKFAARVVKDKREAAETDADGIFSRDWAGKVEMQTSPWMVSASHLDGFGRWCGGGTVAFFDSLSAARVCAEEINRLNPAHEAEIDLYDEGFFEPRSEGWALMNEWALPDQNGSFTVKITEPDRDGNFSGGQQRILASFHLQQSAEEIIDLVTKKCPECKPELIVDERRARKSDVDGLKNKTWPGENKFGHKYVVRAVVLDNLDRGADWVSFWFDDEVAAKGCAEEICRLNPRHHPRVWS